MNFLVGSVRGRRCERVLRPRESHTWIFENLEHAHQPQSDPVQTQPGVRIISPPPCEWFGKSADCQPESLVVC